MHTVAVTLGRRYAWINSADEEIYQALLNYWSYSKPGAFYAPSHRLWLANKAAAKLDGDLDREVEGWDGKVHLMHEDSGKLPAGLFRATKKEAEQELGIKFEVTYKRPQLEHTFKLGFNETNPKYDYQNKCTDAMLSAMHRGGGVVLAATRTGKTKIVSQLFSKLTGKALMIVDTIDLLYQSQQEIEKWLGEKVGIVGDSEFQPERITVGTIQTLQKHRKKAKFKKWYSQIDVLVIDELHKALAKRNFKLLEQIKPIAIYGLTATLQLKKKEVRYRVYSFCGPVIFEFPVIEGMETGVLTKGRIVQLLFPALADESKDSAIAYREETLEHPCKLLATRKIVDYLVDQGRYVMVLVDRIAHVKEISSIIHDIPHAIAYGAVSKVQRKADRTLFDDGDIQCLIANRVYEKGITLKRVDIGLDLAELPNKNDCVQKLGRMAGLHPDKHSFIYFDIGTHGNSRRSKAARMRASAYRAEGLEVKVVKLTKPLREQASEALAIVEKELKKDERTRM